MTNGDIRIDMLIYLYCITSKYPQIEDNEKGYDFKIKKISNYFVIYKYVLFEEFSEESIKNNISDIVWLEKNVKNHLDVITEIMSVVQVIPINFGTVYYSEENLRDFIIKYSDKFNENIYKLENKEEWSVKAYCNRKILLENIEKISNELNEINSEINNSLPGKAYILRKKKDQRIEKEVKRLYNDIYDKIFEVLKDISVDCKCKDIKTIHETDENIDMVFNAAYLVYVNNINKFINCCEGLISEYQDTGVEFEVKGPWPPYTFIEV